MKLIGLSYARLQLAYSDRKSKHRDREEETDEHKIERLRFEVALQTVEGRPRDAEEVTASTRAHQMRSLRFELYFMPAKSIANMFAIRISTMVQRMSFR